MDNDDKIIHLKGAPLTRESETWASVAGSMLEESLRVGRDYARLMIQMSFGAIPVYVALYGLFPHAIERRTSAAEVLLIAAPAALFIASAITFAVAFYPISPRLIFNIPDTSRKAHQKVINRRQWLNFLGTALFAGAAIASIFRIITYR